MISCVFQFGQLLRMSFRPAVAYQRVHIVGKSTQCAVVSFICHLSLVSAVGRLIRSQTVFF